MKKVQIILSIKRQNALTVDWKDFDRNTVRAKVDFIMADPSQEGYYFIEYAF